MATSAKRLGATTVSADTDTSLYAASSVTATVSLVQICNRGSSAATFRVAVVDGAIGSVANEDYLYYDCNIPANDSIALRLGIVLEDTHSILVRSDSTDVNFLAFGIETA
jgi:hypothetical protein